MRFRDVLPVLGLGLLLAACAQQTTQTSKINKETVAAAAQPETPSVVGDWWRIAQNPDIGAYSDEKAQPVDFSIWQAADGTWQLVSCVRYTKFPGATRLFYRWESPSLTQAEWTEKGIFLTSDDHPDHQQGSVQAPHVIKENGEFIMFYNSGGSAYVLRSQDGKKFTQHLAPGGKAQHFEMGRDVMVFDNRTRDGKVYAYYTAIMPPKYEIRRNHTIGVRIAPGLDGPWGEVIDVGVNTPNNMDPEEVKFNFINAESPFVIFRKGYYYRWEQMKVFASTDPLHWPDPEVTTLTGDNPRGFYAPEVIEHQGETYVTGYKYRDERQGIYMARLRWQ